MQKLMALGRNIGYLAYIAARARLLHFKLNLMAVTLRRGNAA